MATSIDTRYRSANELSDELERWLGDEPVRACPPSLVDKAWRWCRRHRDWVIAGMVVLTVATTASLLAARAFRKQAEREQQLATKNLSLANSEAEARKLADERFLDARETVDRWLIGYTEALRNFPGVQQARRRMLEQAAANYARFSEQQVDDPMLQLEQGRTLLRLGYVRRILGDPAAAAGAYQHAIHIFERLNTIPDVPADVDLQRTRGLLALSLADRGDFSAADAEFVKAEENLRGLLAQRSNNFERAVQLFAAAAQLNPDQPRHHEALAATLLHVATVERRAGRLGEEIKAYQNAIATYQDLLDGQPDVPAYREGLAMARTDLGQALVEVGELAESAWTLREATAMLKQLALAHPLVAKYREAYAVTLDNLADALLRTGETEEAVATATAARDALRPLTDAWPAVAVYRRRQGVVLSRLAQAHAVRSENDAAAKRFDEALEVFDLVLQQLQPEPEALYAAAVACTRRGEWLWWRDKKDQARESLQKAASLWSQLVEQSSDPQFADAAAWFLMTCPADELTDHVRASELATTAHRAAPETVVFC